MSVTLDSEPDEENPCAMLRATHAAGEMVASARVAVVQADARERQRLGRGRL